MRLPFLQPISSSRQIVEEFRGYNHNLRIGDGEFFDMKNMTSDYYPILSPRGQRGVYQEYEENSHYTGMISKDALCYVKDGKFYINKSPVEDLELNDDEKQLVSMGAYVIILPDKKWVNTEDQSFGDIDATYTVEEASYAMCKLDGTVYDDTKITAGNSPPENPDNLRLWIDTSTTPHSLKQYSADTAVWTSIATTYVRISATGIGSNFKQYDAVKISGLPDELKDMNNTTCVLWDVKQDSIVIVGLLEKAIEKHTETLTIKRTMPEMDFVIEANNRLWGCFYGMKNGQVVNEIYCSKLGDFKNWECYMGISTDSWAASVGTDGQWTGAITHLGYPLFFKENYLHKVYGNYPANFQIQTTECNGVEKSCHKSLAIVNTTLFYKGRSGIYAYDGSLPVGMSYPLGNKVYSYAVGGSVGNKYYVSMQNMAGDYNLFVFDTQKSLWHKEDDDLQVDAFCSCDKELYAIVGGDAIITMLGSGTPDPSAVEWMVETGDIGLSSPDSKYISRLNLRMQMDLSSEIYISIRYDFNEAWEQVAYLTGDRLQSFTIPIIPKRCDSMRLRIEGMGNVKIYSITKTIDGGSDLP